MTGQATSSAQQSLCLATKSGTSQTTQQPSQRLRPSVPGEPTTFGALLRTSSIPAPSFSTTLTAGCGLRFLRRSLNSKSTNRSSSNLVSLRPSRSREPHSSRDTAPLPLASDGSSFRWDAIASGGSRSQSKDLCRNLRQQLPPAAGPLNQPRRCPVTLRSGAVVTVSAFALIVPNPI